MVEELNPTHGNLIGRIEHIAQMGTLVTDFLLIKPGALHRANGGYLLLDVRKVLLSPFAWEALKRAIKTQEIRIEQLGEASGFSMISTQTLDPEPIPLDVRVVLFGDRELYYMLSAADPDFWRLFKVQADFDDSIARSTENDHAYARLIASIVKEHGLKPFDASGVARLIDEGARLADDREKLSIEIGRIADIAREADYWSSEARRKVTARQDVARAIEEQIQRADRLRDRAQETIARGVVLLDTEGAQVGQINGLSVLQLGSFAFGRPARITARVRLGSGRVTDIEREVKLGGPLHSKGVMILWGFLAGRYALDVPLALAATLVFEQSYGGVDGDSASAAELLALLSALSEQPIKQSLAVTGSINQWGEVQAIGGVNEKIEGFFDICRERGLNEQQGVLIPKSNVQHLMLREDVVEAARHRQFAIYPVATIDEAIEILTGIKAGERGPEGRFPAGTINRLVEDKLKDIRRARARLRQGLGQCRRECERRGMIAHVAETGENRGRVVLQLGSAHPSAIALEAAVRIARAFQSEIESVFVEDEQLFDCAAYGFVREVSLTGRRSRAVSAAGMTQDLRLAAQGARRQLEALARLAEVPLRSRVVRDEPLRALAIACAESGPWNVVALAEPFAGGNSGLLKQLLVEVSGTTGLVMVGPRARRVTGPTVIAVEDADDLPSLLRAAERLTALDGAQIVLLLIARDEEGLERMDGQVRLVVEAREDVRIETAAMARGEAAVVAEALRRQQRRLRHLPVRRPGRARRRRPQAARLRARVPAVPGAVEALFA